jgi:hypothetical protein
MKRIVKLENILVVCGLALIFCGCKRDEIFEKEQYKHVFSLVSHEDTYNIFNMEVHLGNPTTDGCVSAFVGGTNPTREDIKIVLAKNNELANRYKDAKLLPTHMYQIGDYNLTIPAGAHEGQMNIKLTPEGISPDSAWFIPLSISSYSGGELNTRKSSVLYRVMIKNRYASQASSTIYQMKGKVGANGVNVSINKEMKPIGKRKVRINAGTRIMVGNNLLAFIQNETLFLEVQGATSMSLTDSVKVKVLPSSRNITVTQIDTVAAYSNIFKITTELSPGGKIKYYKNFRLHYQYRLANGTSEIIKEDLRLEFKPEAEKEEDYR